MEAGLIFKEQNICRGVLKRRMMQKTLNCMTKYELGAGIVCEDLVLS